MFDLKFDFSAKMTRNKLNNVLLTISGIFILFYLFIFVEPIIEWK